jgi:putative peptidoglycan lipid II flippase
MVRVIAATFYARHDTATPVRATMLAVVVNIAFKFLLVWGFHLGAAGVALGTSFGSWANVLLLVYLAQRRGLLAIDKVFLRSLFPAVLAALATGAAALWGATLAARVVPPGIVQMELSLGIAVLLGAIAYAAVTWLFRRRLPLGRLQVL